MSNLKILTQENPLLRQKAKRVNPDDILGLKSFIKDMIKTMRENKGVGLAAPQVGQSLRIIVVETKDRTQAFINPVIVKKSWKKEEGEEGCLSIPGLYGLVKRNSSIRVKALDEKAKMIDLKASGLLTRVIQHEIDHLEGILFTDRTKKVFKIKEGQDSVL